MAQLRAAEGERPVLPLVIQRAYIHPVSHRIASRSRPSVELRHLEAAPLRVPYLLLMTSYVSNDNPVRGHVRVAFLHHCTLSHLAL